MPVRWLSECISPAIHPFRLPSPLATCTSPPRPAALLTKARESRESREIAGKADHSRWRPCGALFGSRLASPFPAPPLPTLPPPLPDPAFPPGLLAPCFHGFCSPLPGLLLPSLSLSANATHTHTHTHAHTHRPHHHYLLHCLHHHCSPSICSICPRGADSKEGSPRKISRTQSQGAGFHEDLDAGLSLPPPTLQAAASPPGKGRREAAPRGRNDQASSRPLETATRVGATST